MSYPRRQLFPLIVMLCLASLPPFTVTASDWQWNTEGRVIAVSDIHGAFVEFTTLLKGMHLIDDDGHWTGSVDHLVIVGDVLDRGAASRDVLALIMRLETEAEHAGGRVHLVLGNHEIMNLVGDLRYVAVDEYARYADVEDPQDRSEELQRFSRLRQDKQLDEATLLNRFNQKHPPGFFGHRQLFSAEGVFGKWLLARPVIIKINGSIFVHGGLSQSVSGLTLDEINDHHQKVLRDYVFSRDYFMDNGVLEAATNFYEQPPTIKHALDVTGAQDGVPTEDQKTARQLFDAYNSEIFDDGSPTWYRGNVGCSAAIEQNRLRLLLQNFAARRLIVGHTTNSTRTIESRFDDMLIRVDTGMLNSHYRGQPAAAVITGDNITAYYPNRPADKSIATQQRRVGPRPGNLTDTELERVLALASIQDSEPRQDKNTRVTIDYEGRPIEALFTAARSKKRSAPFLPEVAAYRLDRYLGLEMTPVAAVRTVDGKSGAITLNLGGLIDEDQRMTRQLGSSAWCSLKDQFNMMYMFDILLHNKGRARNAMRYVSGNMRLILTGNGNTLGTEHSTPRYLKLAHVSIPAHLKLQLQRMNAQMLEELLGDVLDAKRRKAILARRDLLLERSK